MLEQKEIERAVELQARGYQLILWLEKALNQGFIAPEAAHVYGSMEESAYGWLEKHYDNIPSAARPAREDLPAFSRLFSTYLTNTFDLEANPGKRLYSFEAHCFCHLCSWMVRVPHLRPKKVGAPDKKVAENMKRGFMRQLALKAEPPASEDTVSELLLDPELREDVALVTYANDLLQRLQGVCAGPASLALWRGFAWTPTGAPKKGFELSADAIVSAQEKLLQRLGRQ